MKALKSLFIGVLCTLSSAAWSFDLDASQIDGSYKLLNPEESAQGMVNKTNMKYMKMRGKNILARLHCERCMPLMLSKMENISEELDRPVFFSKMGQVGVYAMAYDKSTFIFAIPSTPTTLGQQVFSDFKYLNVHSKGSTSLTETEAKNFVINESKRLMSGDVKTIAQKSTQGGAKIFYPLSPDYIAGKKTSKIGVELSAKQKVVLSVVDCPNCSTDTYVYNPQFSKDTGKPIYRKKVGHQSHTIVRYLVKYDKDTWLKVYQASGLGHSKIDKTDTVNVLAATQAVVRKINAGGAYADNIEKTLIGLSNKALDAQNARYDAQDKARTAKNKLPKANEEFASFNELFLAGAKQRAQREGWEEQLIRAYAVGSDWTILRHEITGIKTGRYISGVVVMKRKDGLCSYQMVNFHQQANDTDYQKPTLYSINSGQEKLSCSKI